MPTSTNFESKRLKLNELKLDIVEKPENRVHKLTDSNVSVSRFTFPFYYLDFGIVPMFLLKDFVARGELASVLH